MSRRSFLPLPAALEAVCDRGSFCHGLSWRYTLRMQSFACPLLLSLLAAIPASAAPLVTFEAQSVVVSSLTPGAEVAYLSVAREPAGYSSSVVRREGRLQDEDHDGTVTIELGQAVPLRSIWLVVEMATGLVLPATPEGYPLRQAEPGSDVALAVTAGATRLGAQGAISHVLVVRPGGGAWVATWADGGTADEDGAGNRSILTGLDALEPLVDGPPPPLELAAGDRILTIDSDAMVWALATVGGAR